MTPPSVATPFHVPASVRDVLEGYRRAHDDAAARLWRWESGAWVLLHPADDEAGGVPGESAAPLATKDEHEYRIEVVGPSAERARVDAEFLAGTLQRIFMLEGEMQSMSAEIAERYEEITLLYSISEILGSVISLEEAAGTILEEVISTLGARRAALWVHDPRRDELYLAASVGMAGQSGPVELSDRGSVTAEVFRECRAMILDPNDIFPRGDFDTGATRRGYFLSVPVSYTPPQGETRTVGVINLVGRTSNEPYTAGDLHLVSAIASQVGAAVENGRLVAETLRRERLVREMELAHDLQLKLLPSTEQFADYATVAACCVPAESVGGDFYHLFRLSGGRFGVMIGDVSSHGFGAALIMALTMSAVTIHASEGEPPAEVLRRVHRAMIGELETTGMYLTLFYGVIDPAAGRITYANAGHHHAFRIPAQGDAERLGATDPPLGMVDLDGYSEAHAEWNAGKDLLFLFTDGLPDALGEGEIADERTLLDLILRERTDEPERLLERIFALTAAGAAAAPPDDRTAVLVRI
ncbi:MAG: SpoIIE family protein phosphatase [Gemmatimonadetes bacterium]|nr:SpoIIE family protein phosphatase [Gemmatimonadota bacterium]